MLTPTSPVLMATLAPAKALWPLAALGAGAVLVALGVLVIGLVQERREVGLLAQLGGTPIQPGKRSRLVARPAA